MDSMTDTQPAPRPSYPMRYVFPSEITDLATAQGLPTETLIRALNMRWLVDGRGTCWPAGTSGSRRSTCTWPTPYSAAEACPTTRCP